MGMLACGCAEDGAPQCELATVTQALEAADRKIVGEAEPYPADPMLRGRDEALRVSQRERRDAAWATVEKVLAPMTVALAEELPALAPGTPATLPRWQTWYGRDDVKRLFQRLYEGLGPEGRAARAPFEDVALDEAFGWNPHAVEELDSWPAERWQAYLEAIETADELAGIGDIGRVGYAPGAARHLIASYGAELGCLTGGAPPPVVDDADAGTPRVRRVLREPVALAACARRMVGPFFVADGEVLSARLEGGADGGGDGTVIARLGAPPTLGEDGLDCAAEAGEACEVDGPGAVWIELAADGRALAGTLTIDYREAASAAWAGCLDGAFPVDAVVIKAEWRRAEFGFTLPVYDTSAAAMTARLAADGDRDWGSEGDAQADPGPDAIYTARLPSDNVYRMPALHIMSKELDHWQWITLWWSPEPDGDFGADRPASLAALGGPWRNYKMCTVTAFAEGDPLADGGYADGTASLGDALAAVYGGEGAPSWCSNPYLEVGHGNASTNCVGCHQHGGAAAVELIDEILADETRFPAIGRVQVRNNFPHDYSWAVEQGDRLGQMFEDEVEYWDAAE
jgi:hypothetical protein